MKEVLIQISKLSKYDWVHNFYYVSNMGYIFNAKTGKRLEPYNQGCGRCQIWLYGTDAKKKEYVYRVVAEAFVPNPDNKPDINHLDENPLNNRADNLEWCTKRENNQYGGKQKRANQNRIKNIVAVFPSNEARIFTRVQLRKMFGNISPILRCCNTSFKKCSKYKGIYWSYLTPNESQLSLNF